MKYKDYLYCAVKHLKCCQKIIKDHRPCKESDLEIWIELYYLSGYILEGLTVYSVYKSKGWNKDKDIREPDAEFTKNTGLDFYKTRPQSDKNGLPIAEELRNRGNNALCVQSHGFQEIIKNLLTQNPSFTDIPYFGGNNIDKDVNTLIDRWNPKIRYTYVGKNFPNKEPYNILNKNSIEKLISTCEDIYKKISNI